MQAHATLLQALDARFHAAFWAPKPRNLEQEARDQVRFAKDALAEHRELRRFNLLTFPGIYRRDNAVRLKSSVAVLALCASRRARAAELRARITVSVARAA